jgi:hypothetical protein
MNAILEPIIWVRDKFDNDRQAMLFAKLDSKSLQRAIDNEEISDNWEIFMTEDFPDPFMTSPSVEDISCIGKACVTYGYAFIYYFLYVALPDKADVMEFENTFIGEFESSKQFFEQFRQIIKDFSQDNYYCVSRNNKAYVFDLRRRKRG